jgi:uncharacterized protein (TIGR03435 family)
MNRRDKKVEESELRHMGLFQAAQEDVEDAASRIQQRLRSTPSGFAEEQVEEFATLRPRWRPMRLAVAIGAVCAAIALVVFLQMPRRIDAHAIMGEGAVTPPVRAGERIEADEVLRVGEQNASMTLADSSRVEVRARSEFSLERAEDGVRIHLLKGGLIVNAAKQVAGHLYVQTKDVTVSVVGTVFLVNAEEEGSRVAVIEGQVRVQQGSTTKNLLPGDQLSTNPKMPLLKVPEEVAWSKNAEVHVALLQQSTTAPVKRLAFEVATVREGGGEPWITCKGIDGVWSSSYRIDDAARAVPLGRCIGVIGLRSALVWLFDGRVDNEPSAGRTLGTDQEPFNHLFQLEAKADDPTTATKADLQEMLRNLLFDRFKLKLRREERGTETGYEMFIASDGVKFKETSGDEETFPTGRTCATPCPTVISGKFSMKRFARYMGTSWTGNGMIVDKTGLTGLYEINLTLYLVPPPPRPPSDGPPAPRGTGGNAGGGSPREYNPSLIKAMQDQLGLRLEWGRQIPSERLVVEHIEMPSEN